MSNEIIQIQGAVDKIREIVPGAECANIDRLPGLIAEAMKIGMGSYSTVFLFSGIEDPKDPVPTTLNPDTGFLEGEDNTDGSQTSFNSSTYNLRSVSPEKANWMTFAIFNPDGNMVTEWSEPVNLRGRDGEDGKQGKDGQKGDKGDKGDPGSDGKDGSWFEFIYLALPEARDIDAPYSQNIDGDCPVFDAEANMYGTNNPTGVSPENTIEYTCQREKNRTTNVWGPGSKPAVGAQGGKIGKDGNGVEYIFTLTNDLEDIPTLPKSDPYKDEPGGEGGHTTSIDGKYIGYDNPQTTSENNKYCGVSIRRQYHEKSDGDIDVQKWSEYSNPIIWASFGKDGKAGGRTVMVYTASEKFETEIKAPVGGGGNPNTNEITLPKDPENKFVGKDNTDKFADIYKFKYISTADFDGDGKMITPGSKPVPMTGQNGQPGEDGDKIQFIYRVLPTKESAKRLINFHKSGQNKLVSDNNEVPLKTDIKSTPLEGGILDNGKYTISKTDGTDNATGIDGVNFYVEVYCVRLYNGSTKSGGPGSDAMYGSIWGEDGADGAGTEYIYKVTPEYVTKEGFEIPTHELYIPSVRELKEKEIVVNGVKTNYNDHFYQNYDFYFGNPGADYGLDFDWHDEPQDVSEDEPVEGVRIRKYDPITKQWGDFGAPKIGNKFAHDGYAYVTSYVFTRASVKPDRPTGGSFDNPIPDFIEGKQIWFDSVPGNAEGFAEELTVYMSKRTFYAKDWDGNINKAGDGKDFDPDWDEPIVMMDTNDFQIEGSYNKECPTIGSFDPYYQKYISKEYKNLDQAEANGRNDYPGGSDTATNARGMATSRLKDNKGSDGSVTEVKGEKGDAGENGTSVEIEGSAAYLDLSTSGSIPNEQIKVVKSDGIHTYLYLIVKELDNTHKLYKWNSDRGLYDDVDLSEIQNGDGYITYNEDPNIDGYLGVGDGDSGEKVGQIQGPAGKTYKLYIRFSDDGGVSFTAADSETPTVPGTTVGKYIGYLVAEESMDDLFVNNVNNYKGALGTGDDGGGEEQVFIASKTDNAPKVPTDNTQTEDYCPEIPKLPDGSYDPQYNGIQDSDGKIRWSDRPMSPTKEYPYIGMVERKASTNDYGKWKGDALNPGYAIFYNKYIWDPTYIELTNDLAVIPLEGTNIDPDFKDSIDNAVLLYQNGRVVTDDDIIGDGGSDKAINYFVKIGNVTYDNSVSGININNETGFISIEPSVLNSRPTEIIYGASYNGKEGTKAMKILYTQNAYEILPDNHVLVRTPYNADDENSGYLLDQYKTFTGTIRKGVENKGINPDGENIYFTFEHTDGFSTDEAETIITTNGKFEINLSDERCLSKIKISVYNADNIEIYEEVGVVADGKDGLPGVDAITTKLINPSAQRILTKGKLNSNTIETGIQIREGIKVITDAEVFVAELPNGININNRDSNGYITEYSNLTITLDDTNIIGGTYDIVFQIKYNDYECSETFSLSIIQNGENAEYYEIYPSSNIVKNPQTNPEPENVYPIVYYVNGSTTTELESIPNGYYINYTIGNTTKKYTTPVSASEITSQLIFELYDSEDALVDYCEVDPLSDGSSITTQLANPNVRIQVNNRGEFNGFGQLNYLQIFSGTDNISHDCTCIIEDNPFFSTFNKVDKIGNTDTKAGSFTIAEPSDSNFERVPGVYPITITISKGGDNSFTLPEILTVSIESQGGESPVIVDLSNSTISVTATDNIISDRNLAGLIIQSDLIAKHGTSDVDFTITSVEGVYNNKEEEITSAYYTYFNKNFSLESTVLSSGAKSDSKKLDIKISGTVEGTDGATYPTFCVLQIVKVSKAAQLKINKSVINIDSDTDRTIEIYVQDEVGIRINDIANYGLSIEVNGSKLDTYPGKYTIPNTVKDVVVIELFKGEELIDWEDIPIVRNGEKGDSASFYKIGTNYNGIVKSSDGSVKVPSEDKLEPNLTVINGDQKTFYTSDKISSLGLNVKYSIDGSSIEAYTIPIDPKSVNKQLVFYLYKEDEDLNEFIEIDVVTDGQKGEPGESITLKSGTDTFTVLLKEDSLSQTSISTNISVIKGTEQIPIIGISVTEHDLNVSSDSWFNAVKNDDESGTVTYNLYNNGGIIPIEESTYNFSLLISTEQFDMYETHTLIVQKSGGENAFGIDLLNNNTFLKEEGGVIVGSNPPYNTSFQVYDGPNLLKVSNVTLYHQVNGDGEQVYNGYYYFESIPNTNFYSIKITPDITEDSYYSEFTDTNIRTIELLIEVTTEDGRVGSTIWSMYKDSNKHPYLIVIPNVINSSTDNRFIKISVYDPQSGIEYGTSQEGESEGYKIYESDDADLIDGYESNGENGEYQVKSNVEGSITFMLYKSVGEENEMFLDSETVPIVRNGSDYIITPDDYDVIAEKAYEYIDTESFALKTELETAQETLQNAINDKADSTTITTLTVHLENTSNKVDALETLKDYFVIDGDNVSLRDDINLTEGQVAELAIAALGADAEAVINDPNSLYADSIGGQSIITLVGTFVNIDAANITSGTLDAERIDAHSITADKLAADVFEGIEVNVGDFTIETVDAYTGLYGENDSGAISITPSKIQIYENNSTGNPIVKTILSSAGCEFNQTTIFNQPAEGYCIDVKPITGNSANYSALVHIGQGKNENSLICDGKITAMSSSSTSDARLKTFLEDVSVDINKISKIPAKYFTGNHTNDLKVHIGTSAQEIQKLFPELVHENEDGILSVEYDKFGLIAIEAIKQLNKENQELKERLARIEERLGL